MEVPYFRPALLPEEIDAVAKTLRSGWLTSGPKVKQFETDFAAQVKSKHALALNSCTAALHLAVEALGLKAGQGVLVPSMTFAATAEIVRYLGGVPILVDCDERTGNMDLDDAQKKHERADQVVGLIFVNVAGLMMNPNKIRNFAEAHNLWVVEDSAHALPAAIFLDDEKRWVQSGENTADVTCFSFYANKTMTTGEGGMAVTDNPELDARMRQMALHGLSQDAWKRFMKGANWDYKIMAPGYKYNMTDMAAALGVEQLKRAESMRQEREAIAMIYNQELQGVPGLKTPMNLEGTVHSWHLYQIEVSGDRNALINQLGERGIKTSVHWRPLHRHPYYEETFGYKPEDCPKASARFERIISLPIFPGMREDEVAYVIEQVRDLMVG